MKNKEYQFEVLGDYLPGMVDPNTMDIGPVYGLGKKFNVPYLGAGSSSGSGIAPVKAPKSVNR